MRLYITPSPLKHKSRELARPDTSLTITHRSSKESPWPSHLVKPLVQNHAILGKRATDDERPRDDKKGTKFREGPVTYTSEQLTTFREQYNAARRASEAVRKKVQSAKDAGLEVSPDDVHELSRLTAITYQQRLTLNRARLGKPLDRRTSVSRQDVALLVQDPEIQQLAKSGVYSAQQLAEYKRSYLDALTAFRSKHNQLSAIKKVRKITKTEKEQLAGLQNAFNLQRKIWERVCKGSPVDGDVDRLTRRIDAPLESPSIDASLESPSIDASLEGPSVDAPLESPPLHQSVQLSGSSLKELAQARKSQREASNAAKLFKSTFGLSRNDAEIQRVAQFGGYSLEEAAKQKRGYLDALNAYREASQSISAVKKKGGTLTPDEEDRLVKIDHDYQLQRTAWNRMREGEQAARSSQPAPKLGRLANDVAALRRNADVDPVAYDYNGQQIAMYDERYLEALRQLRAFQHQISLAQKRGRSLTATGKDELKRLREVCDQRRTEWARVRQGLWVDSVRDAGSSRDAAWSVTYSAEEIQAYNQIHLAALQTLRAAEKKMAAGRDAGRVPTADDEVDLRALRDDFNKKKLTWIRARDGKPVDRLVYKARAESGTKRARSQESRPGSPAQPSQAEMGPRPDPDADPGHSTPPPLQMSRHRLLAPALSTARRFLHALSRPWRAMPRACSPATPRWIKVKPAELLRAEPTL
ncbi:MAG: hypothetical protein M1826_004521 [Phylliscum demangeonii]|nr:MAG: hypothetical protein M1826_004521 [Phylliscum demangeonii]